MLPAHHKDSKPMGAQAYLGNPDVLGKKSHHQTLYYWNSIFFILYVGETTRKKYANPRKKYANNRKSTQIRISELFENQGSMKFYPLMAYPQPNLRFHDGVQ